MPKHWEFVLAAYFLWAGVFAVYWIHLVRKSRMLARSLERMGSGDESA